MRHVTLFYPKVMHTVSTCLIFGILFAMLEKFNQGFYVKTGKLVTTV